MWLVRDGAVLASAEVPSGRRGRRRGLLGRPGVDGAFVLRPDPELLDPVDGVSADELLRALVDTGAAQVLVLPNGYVSAEDLVAGCTAAIGWGIDVVPLPAGSMAQGLAALAVHDPGNDGDRSALFATMDDAIEDRIGPPTT